MTLFCNLEENYFRQNVEISVTITKLYRSVSHGNRHVQTLKDATTQQRPRLLLPLPNITWTQIHSFSQCTASGLETQQSSS